MLSDSSSTSDAEMFSATSGRTQHGSAADTNHQNADENIRTNQQNTESSSKMDAKLPVINEEPPALPSLDLLGRVKGMYRLLDLINEQGSGGIGAVVLYRTWLVAYPHSVDKIIIAKESIARFANHLHPGSYRSLTQVSGHSKIAKFFNHFCRSTSVLLINIPSSLWEFMGVFPPL